MTKVIGEEPSANKRFQGFSRREKIEQRVINNEFPRIQKIEQGMVSRAMKFSLEACKNGKVTEALQNILRGIQDLEMPGQTGSGSEMCCQKQGNGESVQNSQSPHHHIQGECMARAPPTWLKHRGLYSIEV